jgi:hypothetical protein
LQGSLGYNTNTKTTRAILAGNYEYPSDFDQATREIFEECARIRLIIPEDAVSTTITTEAWWGHWSKLKEKTSSSISGCPFGHYIAGMRLEHVTSLHALVATLVTKRGLSWIGGLRVYQ